MRRPVEISTKPDRTIAIVIKSRKITIRVVIVSIKVFICLLRRVICFLAHFIPQFIRQKVHRLFLEQSLFTVIGFPQGNVPCLVRFSHIKSIDLKALSASTKKMGTPISAPSSTIDNAPDRCSCNVLRS